MQKAAKKNNILTTTSTFSAKGFDEKLCIINNPYKRKLKEEELMELIYKYQPVGIIAGVEPITRKVLLSAENLCVISRCGTGLDSVDLIAAKELGINVLNTPDAPTSAVAELTIGLILAVLRHIPGSDIRVRDHKWEGSMGRSLEDKTIGIIGCGRIGTSVAKICNAFGCNVIGYDPYVQSHLFIQMTDFEELLKKSDIITLHIPHTPETKGIISKKRISSMKKDAIIINVARGGLIDEQALYESLANGCLYGAGIDCFSEEPYSGRLCTLDNVVLTPHIGSLTAETRAKMELKAMENLTDALKEMEML